MYDKYEEKIEKSRQQIVTNRVEFFFFKAGKKKKGDLIKALVESQNEWE